MNRFERYPVVTLVVVVAVLLGLVLAASEALLRPGSDKEAAVGGDTVVSPLRFLPLREWQPATRLTFGAPEIRAANARDDLQPVYPMDIDPFGFIEPSIVHADADLEIVFVGGSTTECLFVKPENRFPHAAGRLLEQRLGLTINSINAGKAGNNTMLSLLATIGKVLPRKPDYIVLMQAANDLGMLNGFGSYWAAHPDFALVRARERSVVALLRDIRDMTVPYTYRTLRRALAQFVAGLGPSSRTAQAAAPEAAIAAVQDMSSEDKLVAIGAEFESALRSYVAMVRAWHIEPVLMTQVNLVDIPKQRGEGLAGAFLSEEQLARGDFTPESFGSYHEYFNAIVRQVAFSEGAVLIDLSRAHDWSDAELYDGLHFLDQGSLRVAEIVAAHLAPIVRERHSAAASSE